MYNLDMNWFFNRSRENETVVIFDVGSSSIGAALAYLQSGKPPSILLSIREDIPFSSEVDPERFLLLMLATFEEISVKIHDLALKRLREIPSALSKTPGRVACVLASPWYAVSTNIVSDKRKDKFDITERYIEEKTAEAAKVLQSKLPTLIFAKLFSGAKKIIEKKIVKIELDGYEVTRAVGKKASSFDVSVFISIAPSQVVDEIKNKIGKLWPKSEINFHSFALMAFATLRDLFPQYNDFIFIDVNGEETDVTVVKDGVAGKNNAFQAGKSTLVRSIVKAFPDISRPLALSLIQNANQEPRIGEKIKNCLTETKKAWEKLFYDTLNQFSEEMFLPRQIFLAVDEDVSTIFSGFIKEGKYNQFTLSSDPFNIMLLDHDKIKEFCTFSEKTVPDPFIATECIFLNGLRHHVSSSIPQNRDILKESSDVHL